MWKCHCIKYIFVSWILSLSMHFIGVTKPRGIWSYVPGLIFLELDLCGFPLLHRIYLPKFLPATTSDESVHICSCMHRYFGSMDLSIYNKTINLL